MNDKINIIIIGYNLPKEEAACIESVKKNTDIPATITFFDNFKSGHTLTEIWNRLIKDCDNKYICLLNNDTLVYPHWLSRMIETLAAYPKCGFVGPSTNCHFGPSRTIRTWEQAEKCFGQCTEVVDPLSGFCLLFERELWRKLGGFDERYYLYGQDTDLEDRGRQLGYKFLWRKDAFVYHIGEASSKKSGVNIKAERLIARKLYWRERGCIVKR